MQAVRRKFGKRLNGRLFAIWGLAFKPNTDDVREAPALVLIQELLAAGARVRAYDPVALRNAREIMGERIEYCSDPYDAADGADGLLIVTEWDEFKQPKFSLLRKSLKTPVIFDGRNVLCAEQVLQEGLRYYAVGRGHVAEALGTALLQPVDAAGDATPLNKKGDENVTDSKNLGVASRAVAV